MCDVNCNYKDRCISFPAKCGSCANNRNAKRDYYIPERPWYPYPYWPYPYTWPWYGDPYPYTWYTTCGDGQNNTKVSITYSSTNSGKSDYYSAKT